ncbi:signal peptidase I [Arthrobacter sp. AQ5-05]|uniref:signal peptidase I n=1 Tax=Arthrobacter sp. AQ5-05 TaxID=2184581 RepID=UPI000DCE22E8|nr:signal peptidase I [Arthrobacter sp. AQ5-05]RAX47987.1 signal peptidase I [Arthrobacter sp. AQ5-05]
MTRQPSASRSSSASAPLRRAGTATSFMLLVAAALAALVLVVVPLLTGSQTYSVLTSSMKPNYGPGTLLVVNPAPYGSLKVGDVVTYQVASGRPEVITHRIVSIAADQEGHRTLVTKGDNNDVADKLPVTEVQVRGELSYAVPYAGFVANWLGTQNRGAVGRIAAAGLIGYGVFTMFRGLRARRRAATGNAASLGPDKVSA